ncbi:MAG: signal peptidase II [Solirubrobacteraceae bacterium]|mgnify:FL=1
MAKAWGRVAAVVVAVIALDQLTKALVRGSLARGEEREILGGVKLVYVRNDGVAFNLLQGGGWLVTALTLAALVALVAFFATHTERPYLWIPTGLLLGGALGNLADRVRDGAVTDFAKLPLWPAFNVADVAITFGVIALVLVLEFGSRRE